MPRSTQARAPPPSHAPRRPELRLRAMLCLGPSSAPTGARSPRPAPRRPELCLRLRSAAKHLRPRSPTLPPPSPSASGPTRRRREAPPSPFRRAAAAEHLRPRSAYRASSVRRPSPPPRPRCAPSSRRGTASKWDGSVRSILRDRAVPNLERIFAPRNRSVPTLFIQT
ncbi:hypothetical protein PVAP13_6NG350166 [Panicum virgatum]|uniref:Uncharacterized protein n=1 Tax=Panicum virgatum TaxID=38727 RepID=A0A8T0R3Z8_PANVG|nr:hypothetical protein PVAP13_6NG350166 [Panicum virgatum]